MTSSRVLSTGPIQRKSTTTEVPVPLLEVSGKRRRHRAGGTEQPDRLTIIPAPRAAGTDEKNHPSRTQYAGAASTARFHGVPAARRTSTSPSAQAWHCRCRLSTELHQVDSSTADFNGFPSSMIQAVMTCTASVLEPDSNNRRTAGKQHLVQLTITSLANGPSSAFRSRAIIADSSSRQVSARLGHNYRSSSQGSISPVR